jgi:CRP/FNR family cyclic AMP-dependent transcriptional regulator
MARHILSDIYLFKAFTEDELSALEAVAEPRSLSAGTVLFNEQDAADALLVVKFGSVQISQSGDNNTVMLATLGTGAHFGEVSFLDGEPRSATARTMEQSEIVVISYEALKKYLDARPAAAVKFYREMALYLGSRLRTTTSDLNFSRARARR